MPTFGQFLSDYGYWAVLAGSLLEGETILALAGFAAHQGYLSLPATIGIAFVGGTLGDQAFFWLGRLAGPRVFARFPKAAPKVQRIEEMLKRHDAPVIIGIRFMYGLRILGPIVIGSCEVSPARFAIFNAIGAAIWAPLIVCLGYAFGQAIVWLLEDLRDLEIALLIAAVLFGLTWWGVRYWRQRQPDEKLAEAVPRHEALSWPNRLRPMSTDRGPSLAGSPCFP